MSDDYERAKRVFGAEMDMLERMFLAAVNPETTFKMAPTPAHCGDETINQLWEGGPILPSSIPPRAFDLHYTYTGAAPEHSRWTCVDINTYDGAPDSEAPCTFVGRGASEKQARMDLLKQFADYDIDEYDRRSMKIKPSRVVHLSPFEPPTYADPVRDESED